MLRPKPKLVEAAPAEMPALSPERLALAKAIQNSRHHAAELESVQRAIQEASGAMYEQRRALDEADADIDKAKADAADHLAAVALGTAGPAPRTIREARAALTDAQDELEAAQAALAALETRLADVRQSAGIASDQVMWAAVAVLRSAPETAATMAAAERAIRDVVRLGSAALWLERQRAVSRHADTASASVLVRAGAAMDLLCVAIGPTAPDLRSDASLDGARVWQAAMTALVADATAPLPGGA